MSGARILRDMLHASGIALHAADMASIEACDAWRRLQRFEAARKRFGLPAREEWHRYSPPGDVRAPVLAFTGNR